MSAQSLVWAVQIVSLIAIPCDHQNCWSLLGLESKFTSGSHHIFESFDGNYMLQGCHNDKAYYLASNGYYLYWSAQHTNWHIYTSLYEAGSRAHCQENSLLRCSSNSGWFVVDGDRWVSAPTANNVVCATTHPSYHPTIHPSIYPTMDPSSNIPTTLPTDGPTNVPSTAIPSSNPSFVPTLPPSFRPTDSPVNVRLMEQQVLDQTTEFSQTEQEDSMEIMILSDELIGGLSLAFCCAGLLCFLSQMYKRKRTVTDAVNQMQNEPEEEIKQKRPDTIQHIVKQSFDDETPRNSNDKDLEGDAYVIEGPNPLLIAGVEYDVDNLEIGEEVHVVQTTTPSGS